MTASVCIVIPCYNEEERLVSLKNEYFSFIKENKDILFCFVNDGSTDSTLKQLEILKTEFDRNVEVIDSASNKGKAEAVRQGIQFCNKGYNHKFIAYLDADLSTSFRECMRLVSFLKKHDEISFVFASRNSKTGTIIRKQKHRFFVGRIIAKIVSSVLAIEVYDTQCGCKIFRKEISEQLFREEFLSKWLFDIEIIFRMINLYGKEKAVAKMIEMPLELWMNKGESKVKLTYFFKLWIDLYQIKKKYSG